MSDWTINKSRYICWEVCDGNIFYSVIRAAISKFHLTIQKCRILSSQWHIIVICLYSQWGLTSYFEIQEPLVLHWLVLTRIPGDVNSTTQQKAWYSTILAWRVGKYLLIFIALELFIQCYAGNRHAKILFCFISLKNK